MTEPLVPPERPTPMIPQRGPDEGYDWDRPDVFPAEPEEPVGPSIEREAA